MGAGALAATIAVAVVARPKPAVSAAVDTADQIIPAGPDSSPTTTQQSVHTVANSSGIPGMLAWDTTGWPGNGDVVPGALEHQHVTGPVDYRSPRRSAARTTRSG